jgi:hypothetical protein
VAKHGIKQKLVHELRKMALAAAYFLAGLNLLALMLVLLAPDEMDAASTFTSATLIALVLAKAMVVADGLLSRFISRGGSFLLAVFQKSLAFTLAMLLCLALERYFHGMLAEDLPWAGAWHELVEQASGGLFLARFTYLMFLFSLYSFIFELGPYFSPRSLSDVVLSRYEKPTVTDAVVMRIGLVAPLTGTDVATRVALSRAMYEQLHAAALEQGAVFELHGGSHAAVVWAQGADFSLSQAGVLFEDARARLAGPFGSSTKPPDHPFELRAAVARGELLTFEVGSPGQRQIVRDGAALDRANELFQRAAARTLTVDVSLEGQTPSQSAA